MVFITVGNAQNGFRRLLDVIDDLAGKGFFHSEPVFIQSGFESNFFPKFCEVESFIPAEEFNKRLKDASMIISHGGGTILSVIKLGKVPVVMPRRKKYGEHVNDHQLQFVQALAAKELVIPAYEPEDLPSAISEARRRNMQPVLPPASRMIDLVSQVIEELAGLEAR